MSSSSNNNISLRLSFGDELAPVVSKRTPSLDFGIDFNNTGQDQPVAAYPNSSALESSSAQINKKLHKQLVKSVKESVDDFKSKLKSQSSEQPKPCTRRSTTPAGQSTAVRFKLPEAFDWDNLDVEKLVPPEANQNPNTQTERKLSFFQRLGGWSIVRTTRANGKNSDMYYRQEGAKSTFRSIYEVVRYIMYEENPSKKKGKRNLNHYNDSRVRKSHPTNMEMGGPSHVMNCDDFTIDVEMIGDDQRYCFHHNAPDQELRANARFTTDDGPTVTDGQSSYLDDEMYAIIGDLHSDWVDENLILP